MSSDVLDFLYETYALDTRHRLLVVPTRVGGYNVYWPSTAGNVRVLIRPDGLMDLEFWREGYETFTATSLKGLELEAIIYAMENHERL